MSEPRHRIQRILTLIPFLRKNPGVQLAELEAYCGAPATEILADLDKILLCGVPPYLPDDYIGVYVDDGRVEIRFAEHFRRPVRFTLPEALALKLAVESLPAGGGEAYREARRSLLEKIGRILGAEAAAAGYGGSRLAATREIEGRLVAHPGRGPTQGLPPARRRNEEVLAVIVPAIEARSELEIEYYSASSDETRVRVVHPYGLVDKSGEHYLVAYCKLSKETRSFRIDRIRAARVLAARFERPRGFSLERFEKREMNFPRHFEVTATVRFARAVARWVREARKGERMEETAEGDLVVTMRAASVPWLLNEVLGYGPNAELLGPPELRKAMRAHLAAMKKLHAR
jgi:proteasome accessory factor C